LDGSLLHPAGIDPGTDHNNPGGLTNFQIKEFTGL
jgi:hypothetical protein